jgi:hypothetical protein
MNMNDLIKSELGIFQNLIIKKEEEIKADPKKRPPTRYDIDRKEIKKIREKNKFIEDKEELKKNVEARLELNEKQEEWMQKLGQCGKKNFYILFSKFYQSFVPRVNGSKGIKVCTDAFLEDLEPFLSGYKEVDLETFFTKNTVKRAPYTGRIYLNFRFRLFKLEQVKKLFSLFKQSLPTQILFLSDMMQTQNRRIDDPKENLPEFCATDSKSMEKQKEYNQREFGKDVSNRQTMDLLIGKTGKERYTFFEILFKLNMESFATSKLGQNLDLVNGSIIAGEFSFRFFTQSDLNGMNDHEAVVGETLEGKDLDNENRLTADNLLERGWTYNNNSEEKSSYEKEIEQMEDEIRLLGVDPSLSLGEQIEQLRQIEMKQILERLENN